MIQRVFVGLGELMLPAGRRMTWTSPPFGRDVIVERVFIGGHRKDFAVDLHAADVGGTRFDYGLPIRLEGGPNKPTATTYFGPPGRTRAVVKKGQRVVLELTNVGPQGFLAAGGMMGDAIKVE